MNDDDHELEQRLAGAMPRGAPPGLRAATLAQVDRELRRARWDRRLSRTAAAVLVLGAGLNAGLVWQGDARSPRADTVQMASNPPPALVATAAIVADATDAETARRFVRQMAALSGWEQSDK